MGQNTKGLNTNMSKCEEKTHTHTHTNVTMYKNDKIQL